MIDVSHVVMGVLMGSVLIGFGLVPGLAHGLADVVLKLSDQVASRFSTPFFRSRTQFHQPRWLAALGAALITVTLAAYFAH